MRPGYRSNKAEPPLLLLFPGCCDDATASVMRIRKLQGLGLPGSAASERGDSTSSAALADESHLLPGAPAAEDSIPDDAPSSRSPALQKSPDLPYMNLDEFVSSLARKNCFPDEETHYKTGESSGSVINIFGDQHVDTSLRLAFDPEPVRIKGGHVIDQQPDDGRLQYGSITTAARIESPLEAGHPEVFGESYQTTSIPEPEEVEDEDSQPEQAMKSSTESMEHREEERVVSRGGSGRRRGRELRALLTTHQNEETQAEEE